MMGIFAEFERSLIVERVRAGLQRARAQGTRLGRPTGGCGQRGRGAGVPEGRQRHSEDRKANAQVYARLLANALKKRTRDIIRLEITGEQGQVAIAPRSQIRAWRMRAEELRTTADQFAVPSAQEALRRAAANYDKMADNAAA
jgi:DNA invertase Pin-like site-specific DNA recombinase